MRAAQSSSIEAVPRPQLGKLALEALYYASKYPQHIQKVILLNTARTNSQERQQQSSSYFLETAELERKKQFEHDFAYLSVPGSSGMIDPTSARKCASPASRPVAWDGQSS
jgi:pimeloyl-ACP methyl ester carboxylesterase